MTEPKTGSTSVSDQADAGWDSYAERVSRNEGRLYALEVLVAETRAADRQLIEQRSDSLAKELVRSAEALRTLSIAERDADLREFRDSNTALREITDTAILKNYEQSNAAMTAMTRRFEDAIRQVEQLVQGWREADREALDKQAIEYERRLGVLNHSHQANADFQTRAVTRELWQAERDAAVGRENVLREQIISLEKGMLSMAPADSVTGARHAVVDQLMTALQASERNTETKLQTLADKFAEMKATLDATTGRSAGYQAFYGWIVAAVGLIVSVIIAANILSG